MALLRYRARFYRAQRGRFPDANNASASVDLCNKSFGQLSSQFQALE